MPNNIAILKDDLARRDQELGSEAFDTDVELTAEEQAEVKKLEEEQRVVMVETGPDGSSTTVPIEEYAQPLDDRLAPVKIMADSTIAMIKAVNQGDIHKTLEDARAEGRARAIAAFRDLSVAGDALTDDDIVALNDRAIQAVANYLGVTRLDSEDVRRRLGKLPISKIREILPEDFVRVYAMESELKSNNYKAKERLLAALSYLITTGPEFDYLNEYIAHEHQLMEVSRRIAQCQIDFLEMIKSPERLAKIAAKAEEIDPKDTSVWGRHITNNPRRVHNEFAQKAVVCQLYDEAYQKLLEEYKSDPDSAKLIQEQIDESNAKYQVYTNVCRLETFREVWTNLETELLAPGKSQDFKRLETLALQGLERIRRAKQDVAFPCYRAEFVKRPAELYRHYKEEFVKGFQQYNGAILQIMAGAAPEDQAEIDASAVTTIGIPGALEASIFEYFSVLLLIAYGRLLKKLVNRDTKYDAIMLDAYFSVYCKLFTDVYLMTDLWSICANLVGEAIQRYPKRKKG